jgi:predicted phage terminase large subunit-like protein
MQHRGSEARSYSQRVRPNWTDDDVDLIEKLAVAEAQESYYAYRQHMDPQMVKGWWQRVVATHLQQFYEDMKAGLRPVLGLSAPPQHGKSRQVTDFISWVSGKNPDLKTIFASFSDDLGIRTNMELQRAFLNPRYHKVFPDTQISEGNVVTQVGRFLRNSSMIEFVNRKGSFRNTTVNGQINGQELGLGVIDDPLKGRKEASSKGQRDTAWNWLTDDFFSRFTKDAGLLIIMTRWHIDDPMARLIERFPAMKYIRFPAIAEHDEVFRKKGEALFPEHKPLDFLLERKSLQSQAGWESVYQQNPIVVGGGMFPIEKFGITNPNFDRKDIVGSVRYWDKAGTQDGGAFTAGVLMHKMKTGRHIVSDVAHGQWDALRREKMISQTMAIDNAAFPRVVTYVEQEPGSGGKESAEMTVMRNARWVVKADRVTGNKEMRADPYAAQVQGGNVDLVGAEWNRDYLDEHEAFPAGKRKDQVDAASGAFNKLNGPEFTYDITGAWIDGDG